MFHGAGLPGVNRFHLCGKGGQGPADADTAGPAGKLPDKGAVAELLVGSDMLRRLEGTVPEKAACVVLFGGTTARQAHAGEGDFQKRRPENGGFPGLCEWDMVSAANVSHPGCPPFPQRC